MSKLEELIAELCPDGVEYRKLGELGQFYGGLSGKSKEDFSDGNAKFATYMNVFSNLSLNIDITDKVKISENERQNTIQYGDILFTGSSETPDECGMSSVLTIETNELLYLNSFCFGLRLNNKKLFNPSFSKYLFRSDEVRKQIKRTASGVTRFNVSKKKMEQVIVPLPPLLVQQEIVRILDNFTERTAELTVELTAEFTARKKQYEYYRNELLTFDDCIPKMKLKDICELSSGGDVPKGHWAKEKIDEYNVPIFSNGVDDDGLYGYTDFPRITEPCVTIAGRGAGCGNAILRKESFFPIIRLISVVPKEMLNVSFLYYCIQMIEFKIPKSGIPQLTVPMVSGYTIPVPPIHEQERIVAILNRFDALCHDLTSGLSGEIQVRRKQYEYYRDKLLTFKEASA